MTGLYFALALLPLSSLAQPAPAEEWLPAKCTVVLLAGLTGDVESENSYRDQLQGWLDFLGAAKPAPERVLVLWENPWTVTPPAALMAQTLNSGREEFLSLARILAGQTNPLVVIAWGHGGMQGKAPVFHVRGPRLTPADFKTVADAAGGESRWLLFFRGSGRFAAELVTERRQILSSDLGTASSDPLAGSVVLKTALRHPHSSFRALAEELGRVIDAWYEERQLARTEEPTWWMGGREPKPLIAAEKASPLPGVPGEKKSPPAPPTPGAPDKAPAAPPELPSLALPS